MPQIWMDNENAGANLLPRSARKAIRESASKKSVLSKLDNVIKSNKIHITPFKDANTKWPLSCAPKLSLCKETLQKQHHRQQQQQLHQQQQRESGLLIEGRRKAPQLDAAHDLYARSADPNDSFDLFDYMEFPTEKCLQNCQKPISQYSMEPLLSEKLLEQLLNNSLVEDDHNVPQIPICPDLEHDELALKSFEYNIIESAENPTEIFEAIMPPILDDFENFDYF